MSCRPGSESCGLPVSATPREDGRPLPPGSELLALIQTRAREERKIVGVHALARTSVLLTMPTRRPLDPGGIPSVPSSKLGKHTPHSAPREAARCRHVSHAARIATPFGCCKPVVLSAVSACRRFSDQAHPPPLTRPRAPFNWHNAVSRKASSEALPEDRPSCCLCSGQGIRFAGYPDDLRSQHSAGKTKILPRRPPKGFLPQSRRRDMTAANRSAK